MIFKCPNCNAPFDDRGFSQFSDHEMPCPNCKTIFKPHSMNKSDNDRVTDEEMAVFCDTLQKMYIPGEDEISEECAIRYNRNLKLAFANLYALGWYLILKGEKDIGYKMGRSAVKALCDSSRGSCSESDIAKLHRQLTLELYNGTDIRFVKILLPHYEVLELIYSVKNYKEII